MYRYGGRCPGRVGGGEVKNERECVLAPIQHLHIEVWLRSVWSVKTKTRLPVVIVGYLVRADDESCLPISRVGFYYNIIVVGSKKTKRLQTITLYFIRSRLDRHTMLFPLNSTRLKTAGITHLIRFIIERPPRRKRCKHTT